MMYVGQIWKLGPDGRWHFRRWSPLAWFWLVREVWRSWRGRMARHD